MINGIISLLFIAFSLKLLAEHMTIQNSPLNKKKMTQHIKLKVRTTQSMFNSFMDDFIKNENNPEYLDINEEFILKKALQYCKDNFNLSENFFFKGTSLSILISNYCDKRDIIFSIERENE